MEFRVGSRQLSARKRKLSPKIEESPDKCPKFVDIQISSWSFTLHLFNPLRKNTVLWVLFTRDSWCGFSSLCQETRLYKYYVEATCNGVKSATVPLCRPKKAWSYLVPCDPYQIDFKVRNFDLLKMEGCFCFDLGIFEEGERPARGDSLLFSMFIGIDWFIFSDRWCNLRDLCHGVGDDWWLSLARKRPRAKGLASLQICLCWIVRAHQTWVFWLTR